LHIKKPVHANLSFTVIQEYTMLAFPPVLRTSVVDPADSASAVDFVNRIIVAKE
jgi:hypothetical protein